jgi:IclR family pca regulon transcriptional regulator
MPSSGPASPDDRVYRVEALSKGLRILALFSERRVTLRLAEIVGRLRIPMPTAFRLVATLVDDGYLERLEDGSFRPGLAVLTLGYSALRGNDIVHCSTLTLRALAESTRQTVNLGVLSGEQIVFVARQSNAALISANVTVGSRLPAVVTSMGKVLLAYRPDEEAAQSLASLGSSPAAWGPNVVQSGDALAAELDRVRRDGYAIQDEEVSRGLRSIAAPLRRGGEVVAAINIAVPAAELSVDELVTSMRPLLFEASAEISRRLSSAAS